MKYEQLKKFILEEMRMHEKRNYQPVMIRYLNQNRGKATRLEIQQALHDANPDLPVKYFKDSPVFDVLTTSHPVADWNRAEDTFRLFDYETYTPHNKAWITTYCDQKIKDSSNPIKPRIILFSAAGKKSYDHFNETITNDVISNTLPGNTILKDFDTTRVWGSIYNSQNFNKWKELKKGDILLFYHNKKYIASGILEGTEHNQELADYLWGAKDEETRKTFELIVFMKPSSVFNNDVDFQKLNKLFDYDKEFMPTRIMDFTTVNKDKTDELIKKFGSLENALETIGFRFDENMDGKDYEKSIFLSEEDFKKMVDAIPLVTEYNKSKLINSDSRIPNPEEIQLCARLQYYCALRIAELLKITPNDIDLENNELRIQNRNDSNSFSITTIHPAVKKDLEKYSNNKIKNQVLFPFTRQLLWTYYKKAGAFAKLNLFKEQNARKIEGVSTSILRESRGRHMLEKGAGEGLTRLKLRQENNNPLFKYDAHTLQELKDWEFDEYDNDLKSIGLTSNEEDQMMRSNIEEIIKKFDHNRNFFKDIFTSQKNESLQIREQFLKKFPIEKIPTMKLKDYVIGKHDEKTGETNRDSFCYYTEKALKIFGRISGRWSKVHGIYWATSDNRYKWNGDFKDENAVFDEIKNEIYSMLIAAKELERDGDWEKFSDFMESQNKIVLANAKSKILCIYFPQLFFELHKKDLLNYILDEFRVENKISDPRYILQKQVSDLKNNHPIMKKWDNIDFSHFGFNIISKDDEHDEETDLEDVEDEIVSGNYYIITQNEGSKYDDIPGVQYAYDNFKSNYVGFVEGTNFIVQSKIGEKYYFIGTGKVGEIIKSPGVNEKGRDITKIIAKFSQYQKFPEKKIRTDEINEKMLDFAFPNKGRRNIPPAMLPIDKTLFDEIINDDVKSITVPEKTFDDRQIHTMTESELKKGFKEINDKLLIPKNKVMEIINALASGHVILAGPIGTGKTELARIIPKSFWSTEGGYFSDIYTATADWNTLDVIGGIVPKMDAKDVVYKIQDGCVTESVRKNWDGNERKSTTLDKHAYHGVWAIIDEFNRADIDKAFGQLFTALRTKEMKIPSNNLDKVFESVKIPHDFRIIGTLNTADKHYLFPLSDALKSRFAIIEIDVPEKKLKDKEIFYALKHAMEHLELKKHYEVILDEKKKIILSREPYKLFPIIYQAYNLLSFVRQFNKLGTAILKIIYQNLLTGHQLKANLNETLDNSINSTIIPQLEKLSELELGAINAVVNDNLLKYLKDVNKTNKRHNSSKVFSKILEFLNLEFDDYEYFTETELKDNDKLWTEIENSLSKLNTDEKKLPSGLNQTSQSLESLMDQSVI